MNYKSWDALWFRIFKASAGLCVSISQEKQEKQFAPLFMQISIWNLVIEKDSGQ